MAGYALDALGGRTATGAGAGADAPPQAVAFDADRARAFLDHVFAAPATEAAAVALGTELHFGDDDVTGGALIWEGAVVHLAAFGSAHSAAAG